MECDPLFFLSAKKLVVQLHFNDSSTCFPHRNFSFLVSKAAYQKSNGEIITKAFGMDMAPTLSPLPLKLLLVCYPDPTKTPQLPLHENNTITSTPNSTKNVCRATNTLLYHQTCRRNTGFTMAPLAPLSEAPINEDDNQRKGRSRKNHSWSWLKSHLHFSLISTRRCDLKVLLSVIGCPLSPVSLHSRKPIAHVTHNA